MNYNKKFNWIIFLLTLIVLLLFSPFIVGGLAVTFSGVSSTTGESNSQIAVDLLGGICVLIVLIWAIRKTIRKEMTYKLAYTLGGGLWLIGVVTGMARDGIFRFFNLGMMIVVITALIWAIRTLLNKD